ncbi:hypothetical protein NEUTE2DRAFT_70559, partial [Neurospora tetrasperma FGSC 2509]
IAYFNNILIYSKNKEDYSNYIKEDLYINLGKYEFYMKRVLFLYYIVSPEGISIDPKRVIIIVD